MDEQNKFDPSEFIRVQPGESLTIPVRFGVTFYDAEGNEIGASSGTTFTLPKDGFYRFTWA